MKKMLDIVGGVLLLIPICVVLIIIMAFIVAILCAWMFPIVAAVKWSCWWLLAEVPIVIVYVWIWRLSQNREVKTVINGVYADREEETAD